MEVCGSRSSIIHIPEVGPGFLSLAQHGFTALAQALAQLTAELSNKFQTDGGITLDQFLESRPRDREDHCRFANDDIGGGAVHGVNQVHLPHGFARENAGDLENIRMGVHIDLHAAGDDQGHGVVRLALGGEIMAVWEGVEFSSRSQKLTGLVAGLAKDACGRQEDGRSRRESFSIHNEGDG